MTNLSILQLYPLLITSIEILFLSLFFSYIKKYESPTLYSTLMLHFVASLLFIVVFNDVSLTIAWVPSNFTFNPGKNIISGGQLVEKLIFSR